VLDWGVVILRSLGAIAILFLFTRLLGKKQIAQLTFFEYVVGITIGDVAAFISTDMEAHFWHGVTTLTMWFLIPLTVEFLTLKSKTLRDWFEGKATVLIKDGKILEDNLKKERFSSDELLEQLRVKNVFNLADVEFALMESSGDISVLLKKESQPLTPKHLGIKVSPEKAPQAVILDGEMIDEGLSNLGLNRGWLQTELDKLGIPLNNVFVGQADSYGQLYIDTYDDQLNIPKPQEKAQLLATLKKCEADLELFALSSQDTEAKRMYDHCSSKLRQVIQDMTPLLKR